MTIEPIAETKAELGSEIALLRAEAGFIADPDRRDVSYWYTKLGLSRFYTLNEVMRYTKVHRWLEKRVAFWRGVQSAWLRQSHLTLIQELQNEFREAKELRDHVLRLIKPKMTPDGVEVFTVQPKSLEGMIRAFSSIDDVVHRKRKEILEYIQPMIGITEKSTVEDLETKQPFSPSEMRKIAHQILEQRRHERRVETNIEDDDYEGDESDGDTGEEKKDIIDV